MFHHTVFLQYFVSGFNELIAKTRGGLVHSGTNNADARGREETRDNTTNMTFGETFETKKKKKEEEEAKKKERRRKKKERKGKERKGKERRKKKEERRKKSMMASF